MTRKATTSRTPIERLFSVGLRSGPEPDAHVTSTWEFLEQSSRPEVAVVREEVERWFARYPVEHRPGLVARLRGSRVEFRSAFLELFLHELLCRSGCRVDVEFLLPNGKRVDFRVTTPAGDQFLLEAAVVSEEGGAGHLARGYIRDLLNGLRRMRDTRVTLSVSVDGHPTRLIPVAPLVARIEQDIAGLNLDAISAEDPRLRWTLEEEEGRVCVEVEAFPTARSAGSSAVGAWTEGIHQVRIRKAVQAEVHRKIRQKVGGHGDVDLPYVVAVLADSRDGWPADHGDFVQALLGEKVMRYPRRARGILGPGIPDQRANGVWWGREGRQNTRLSAVLAITQLWPWSFPRAAIALYQNPWAKRPYESVLCRLPRYVPVDGRMQKVEGPSLAEIFGLPAGWPGPRE